MLEFARIRHGQEGAVLASGSSYVVVCCRGAILAFCMPPLQLETEEAARAPRFLAEPLTTAEPTLACENCNASAGYQLHESVGWCRGSDVCLTLDATVAPWPEQVANCWQACELTAAISRRERDLLKVNMYGSPRVW